jgi:thiamine-phosphate pyrophosphorylase
VLVNAGVHVGQDDLTPVQVKRIVGGRLVGYSTHNEIQFTSAGAEAAGYLAFGPLFPTASKQNPDPVVGVEMLSRLRRLSPKPLVAIGGITRETAAAVWNAGADTIAVIGDMMPPDMNKESIRRRFEEWNRLPR